ncbi:MAG TPA: hypothetical protein VND24_01725 [Steroidobacteraceae bacterium]|nr:hypothetical protein [Steroidobacteraceae bacterium]
MSHPDPSRIGRVGELPREIAPPHDGWPALEARLRESGMPRRDGVAGRRSGGVAARGWSPRRAKIAAVAAVLAAVAVGISIDRWFLSPTRPVSPGVAAPGMALRGGRFAVAYVTDPRYLREREALLRSLGARLAKLPPSTRGKVLQSLATIHQSMRQVQQALGRDPGNALLQALLIDTYQDEMQVLSTVQEASGGGGET